MEDLKIKIDNNLDELIELFVQLGCKYFNHTCTVKNYLIYESGKVFFCKLDKNFKSFMGQEITIDQLKDMVVLNRNDPIDANVYQDGDIRCLYDLYLTDNKELYFYHCGKEKWILSNLNHDEGYYKLLKPITKETQVKEYLQKLEDGTYKLVVLDSVVDGHEGLIEVPDGAEIALRGATRIFFRKIIDSVCYVSFDHDHDWDTSNYTTLNESNLPILWQRYTQPEELPFIDNEPKSLNDQYAEIEKVRQAQSLPELNIDNVNHPKHYNKGGVECISAIQASMSKESFCGYLKGNIVKYMWRYEDKGGVESLQKAQWYLNKLIENES